MCLCINNSDPFWRLAESSLLPRSLRLQLSLTAEMPKSSRCKQGEAERLFVNKTWQFPASMFIIWPHAVGKDWNGVLGLVKYVFKVSNSTCQIQMFTAKNTSWDQRMKLDFSELKKNVYGWAESNWIWWESIKKVIRSMRSSNSWLSWYMQTMIKV